MGSEQEDMASPSGRAFVPAASSQQAVSPVPASIPDAAWQIFGDWRDLRNAIERSYPDWQRLDGESRKEMWAFVEGVLAEYAPLRSQCMECRSIISARAAYRCTECKGHLCETCIYPHFGESRWRHK